LIDWEYDVHAGEHRTVTLVLAEERSVDAIRDALFVRRTAAWMGNWLIGREEVVLPLIEASLRLTSAEVRGGYELIDVTLENDSDADFELRVTSGHRFNGPPDTFRVPSREAVDLGITGEPRSSFELAFEVLNAVTAPETHTIVRYQIEVDRTVEP